MKVAHSSRFCLHRVRRDVAIESEWAAQKRERAADGSAQQWSYPTQANNGLEWATRQLVRVNKEILERSTTY